MGYLFAICLQLAHQYFTVVNIFGATQGYHVDFIFFEGASAHCLR
jgi:hypothetical protein